MDCFRQANPILPACLSNIHKSFYLNIRKFGNIIQSFELQEGLSWEVWSVTLSYGAVRAPLLLLLQLQEVVVYLVQHEVRNLGGVQTLGAYVGRRTVAPGLALGLHTDSLQTHSYDWNIFQSPKREKNDWVILWRKNSITIISRLCQYQTIRLTGRNW